MADLLDTLSADARDSARRAAMPEWLDPMLAKLTHDYFDGPEWMFERKLDGERVLAFVGTDGEVRLRSRNRKTLNESYPEVEAALKRHAQDGCVLDGEVVAFDAHGVSDFQRLQPRMNASSRKESKESDVAVYYYVFDCPYADGHDLSGCAIRERKKLLREAVEWGDPLRFTPHRNGSGIEYYREACEKGWEGLIAKRADSAYVHGRSPNWLKFKCRHQQEFVICGFTDPKGGRTGFGALLLGVYRDGDLVDAGRVGTGFDDETLDGLRSRLGRIERETSPYDADDPDASDVHFVTPRLVCEVAFTEWTADGKLRHPRFKGMRRDKEATDVHREQLAQEADI